MSVTKLQLLVEIIQKSQSSGYDSFIHYDEEGYDVILSCETHGPDLASIVIPVFNMCRQIRDVKGKMIPLKIDVTANSEKIKQDFLQLKRNGLNSPLTFGEPEISVNEKINTKLPGPYAFECALEKGLSFSKYRKKKV